MAKSRRAPRAPASPPTPSPRPANPSGDVFRGKVVSLDDLEATLNAWHAAGFTDLAWEFVGWAVDGEPWQGEAGGLRAFAYGWREDRD